MKVLRKASALQNYLSTHLSLLQSSKTLIVSSAPAPREETGPQKTDQILRNFQSGLQTHIDQCQFFTSMQFNLQTISYGKNTLTAAYPTKNNVDEALELMKRTGATNVIGVGTGPAIDLAKACYYRSREEGLLSVCDNAKLILNPSTMGAILSASSRNCLMLCPHEEALLPCFSSDADYAATTIVLDDKSIAIPEWFVSKNDTAILRSQKGDVATIVDSVLACLVVSLDAAHSLGDILPLEETAEKYYSEILDECVTNALACIDSIETSLNDGDMQAAVRSSKEHAITSMLCAGQLLSFGQSTILPRRNVSVAMTSALLPKYFPRGNWSTFVSSLLPGLCHAINESESSKNNELLQKVASRIAQTEDSSDPFPNLIEWVEGVSYKQRQIDIPCLSSLAEGAPDPNELVAKVEDNGAFINCYDADSSFLEILIGANLNR